MIKQSKYVPAPMLCDSFVGVTNCGELVVPVRFEFSGDDIVISDTSIDVTTQELERDYEFFMWAEL